MTPISQKTHMKTLMMIRMMRFVEKPVLRQLLRLTMKNTQSVTGRNIRGIMLMTKKSRVEDLTVEDRDNQGSSPARGRSLRIDPGRSWMTS